MHKKYSWPKGRPSRQDNQNQAMEGWFCFSLCTKHLCGPHRCLRKGGELRCTSSLDTTETTPYSEESTEKFDFCQRNSAVGFRPFHKKKKVNFTKMISLSKLWVISVTKSVLQINWNINLPAEHYSGNSLHCLLQPPSPWKHSILYETKVRGGKI